MGASASVNQVLRIQNQDFPVTNLENLFVFHPFESLLGTVSAELPGVSSLRVGLVGNTDPTKMAGDLTLTMRLLQLMPAPVVLIADYRTCGVYRTAGYHGQMLLTNFLNNDTPLWFLPGTLHSDSAIVDQIVSYVGTAPNQQFEETPELLDLLRPQMFPPEPFDFLIFSNILGSVSTDRYKSFLDSFPGMNRFRYFILTEYNMNRVNVAFSLGYIIQTGLPLDLAFNLEYVSPENFNNDPQLQTIQNRLEYVELIQPMGVFLPPQCAETVPESLVQYGLAAPSGYGLAAPGEYGLAAPSGGYDLSGPVRVLPYIFTYVSFITPDDPEILVYFIVFLAIALRVWQPTDDAPEVQVLTFKVNMGVILETPDLRALWDNLIANALPYTVFMMTLEGRVMLSSHGGGLSSPRVILRTDMTAMPPADFAVAQQYSLPVILLTGDQSVSEMISCSPGNFRVLFYHPLPHKQIFKRGLCNTVMFPMCAPEGPLGLQDYFSQVVLMLLQGELLGAVEHIDILANVAMGLLNPATEAHQQVVANFALVHGQFNLNTRLPPILRAIFEFFGACQKSPPLRHHLEELTVRANNQTSLLPIADRRTLLLQWRYLLTLPISF